jgi:SAM-dependent methyltransferase
MSKLRVARELLWTMIRKGGRPALNGIWNAGNTKIVAYEIARQRMLSRGLQRGSPSEAPTLSQPLKSMVCMSADWDSEWLPYWAAAMDLQPALHRKIWEFAYIAQALSERNMLGSGRTALGFGCGREPLASLFAVKGCSVLATDLSTKDDRARSWNKGQQHADSPDSVWMPSICPEDIAKSNLRFQSVDMNAVPSEFHGRFDFCWSACALEHLGSIEKGLQFIRESCRCLKSGGVAVHTTELNLETDRTLDNHPTVLFERTHFGRLARELASEHVHVEPIVERIGDEFLDSYIDTPPYPSPRTVGSTMSMLHLRLVVASFRTTSVGVIITKS